MSFQSKIGAAKLTAAELVRVILSRSGLDRDICIGPYGQYRQVRFRRQLDWVELLRPTRWRAIYADHLSAIAKGTHEGPQRHSGETIDELLERIAAREPREDAASPG